ncbi:hypothetical protein WA158_004364 [Blastocystis sp. Blastoise]
MNRLFCFALLLAFVCAERSFEVKNQTFYMDGQKFQYVSGSFHYFRVHPDRWEDVFQKMVAGGLNAVQTYVAWNLHEPQKGVFNFEGIADIERWLALAQKYGLYVIMRPGPYICAEWDFGGLPYWLVKEDDLTIRVNNAAYLKHVDDWFNVLLPKFVPFLYRNGGNIISVQIENEYGLYGKCDKDYLKHLVALNHKLLGDETLFFTMDPPSDGSLTCGNVEGTYMSCDFGTGRDVNAAFNTLRKYDKEFPLTNSEFYPGWLDHWGEGHHRVSTESIVKTLDEMLAVGASVNFYMYIGGTNFAWFAGANGGGDSYQSDPTNYDYDAPLSECTDATSKLYAIREVIKKYIPVREFEVKNYTKAAFGDVKFTQGVSFWDAFEKIARKPVESEQPIATELLDHDYGYVLYTTQVNETGTVKIPTIRDQAYVYINKKYVGVHHRSDSNKEYTINETGELEILVEVLGRINYDPQMQERHGLPKGVLLNGKQINGFLNYVIDLSDISKVEFKDELPTQLPVFYKTEFAAHKIADTFLYYKGWGKGVAWVNGFNLGRYWQNGPQFTLYTPSPIVRPQNELIILETEKIADKMTFQDYPIIG